jgi:hypothetical protein
VWVPESHPGTLTWGFANRSERLVGFNQDRRVARFYRLVRLVIDLLVLRGRRDRSKDVEILVLRHQLAVLSPAPSQRALLRTSTPWTDAARALADRRYGDAASIFDPIPRSPCVTPRSASPATADLPAIVGSRAAPARGSIA